jgi:cell division protein FtsN
MAPRKGKGRQAVRNSSGGFPGWGYAVIGILIGAILMAVMMRGSLLTSMKPTVPQANPQATAQRGSDPGVLEPASSESAPKKPQYDFYSVLSEKEVRIPDAVISAQARAEQQQKQLAAQQQAQAAAQQPVTAPPVAVPPKTPGVATENVTAAPAAAVPTPAAGTGYLLQVGAFPNSADAETLKAKLAMQGFVANVQSVKIGGQSYNRVRLGPFRSATELESTKQRLASTGINAIALKEGR